MRVGFQESSFILLYIGGKRIRDDEVEKELLAEREKLSYYSNIAKLYYITKLLRNSTPGSTQGWPFQC